MKLTICLFWVVILTSWSPCILSQKQPESKPILIEYYSTVPFRESPYPDLKGVIRLTAAQAKQRNHYRFERDSLHRIISISFHLGNTLREPNHTANLFFTTPLQQISYEHEKETRTFYDRFGNQVSQRGAYKEVFLLDKTGRKVRLYFEDEAGNRIENDWGISEYVWKHHADGSVTESRYNLLGKEQQLRPGFEFYTIRLCYEQNGSLALMQNVDTTGQLAENSSGAAQDRIHFDAAGRWLGWSVLDQNGALIRGNSPNVAKGINTTNEWGYETAICYEDEKEKKIMNAYGFWGSKRFYDSYGNTDLTYFTDSTGNPGMNIFSGYTFAKYNWDSTGLNKLSVTLLDKDQKPVLHKEAGFHKIRYQYTQNRLLSKTSYHGLNGELVSRTDNSIAYITYEYNTQNKHINTKRFDKNGNEL